MTGHAAGQRKFSPWSSPLPLQPFQKETNQRLTEEEALIGIQQRKHCPYPHPAKATDKGQDQAKNGREGPKNESSVQRIYNCLSSSRSQPFCQSLPVSF